MTKRHPRPTVLAAVVLLVTAACSGGDDAATSSSASSTDARTTTTEPSAAAELSDDAAPTANTVAAAPGTAPATTAAPATTTPPTTEPPPPPTPSATVAAAALTDRRAQPVSRVSDVDVVAGDAPVGVIVGSHGAEAGVARHAATWVTSDGENIALVMLDDGGALESTAYGVGIRDTSIAVSGAVTTPGGTAAVVWRSDDAGASFTPPEVLFEASGLAADVARTDAGLVVAAWRDADPDYELVVVRETADGWQTAPLPVTGTRARVSGIVAANNRVVITGSSEVAGRQTGRVWWSDDAGATFAEVSDPVIETSRSIGDPINGGDGVIATAGPTPGEATTLVTSADGTAWRSVELSMRAVNGDDITPINGGSAGLTPWRDGFAVGFNRQLAAVGEVGTDGRGEWAFAPYDFSDRYGTPRPMVVGGDLFSVGSSATSFRVARRTDTGWSVVGAPPGGGGVPEENGVELFAATDGPVARAGRWPEVRPSGGGGITWGPDESWTVLTDGDWESTRTPSETRLVLAHGGNDVAFGTLKPDPDDDDVDGPSAGTWVTTRNGAGWNAQDPLLTGPGGEYVEAAVTTPAGLIAVGTQYLRDERGVDSSNVLIREYPGDAVEAGLGGWNVASVDADLGTLAELYDVISGGDGTIVATGSIFEDDRYRPLVVTRTGDGWVRSDVPVESDDVDLWAEASTPAGVELYTQEDQAWFVYRSADGLEWRRSPIVFDDPGRSFPLFVANVDGQTILIGFRETMLVRTLAMWALAGDGTTTPIEITDPPVGRSFSLSSILPVGDDILVGGALHQKNTVWTITVTDLPS